MSKWSSAYRDTRWQKKRLEIMERDNYVCQNCGATGEGVLLNVHHAYYEKGVSIWEYPNDSLITWCDECHKKRHDISKKISKHLIKIKTEDLILNLLCLRQFKKTISVLMHEAHPSMNDDDLYPVIKSVCKIHNDGYMSGHSSHEDESEN